MRRPLATLALALLAAGSPSAARADTASTPAAQLRALLPPGSRPAAPADRVAGDDIQVAYTVDPTLESEIHGILEAGRAPLAHVIVLDPATGAVLAYVSSDPERFPATRAYPTASLMKVVTAAAVLRRAPEAAQRDCRYTGSPHELRTDQLEPPAAGGRVESFAHALATSNNPCFARLAVHDLGEDALLAEIRDVGLLEAAGGGHPAGWVAPLRGAFHLGRLGSGIGGSFIAPLGAARLAAALADGALVEPYWIAEASDARGEALALPERAAPRAVWSPEIAAELRALLVGVTERGTAANAFRHADGTPRLGPVGVAGKTGTVSGRDPDGRYQWFIGVAPAETPRVAIASLVVSTGPGGSSAADVAAASLAAIFCDAARCDAALGERLHAQARDRDAARAEARARQLRAHEEERERAAVLRNAYATAAAHEVIALDEVPRPLHAGGFDFPPRLRRQKVSGRIVLLLRLSETGKVLDVAVDFSDLPDFDAFVAREVKGWRFTPPTQGGVPVEARTRLPIPIHVN